jgi:hypothetical protein
MVVLCGRPLLVDPSRCIWRAWSIELLVVGPDTYADTNVLIQDALGSTLGFVYIGFGVDMFSGEHFGARAANAANPVHGASRHLPLQPHPTCRKRGIDHDSSRRIPTNAL